jgi:O-antigen/teichoic acid export membrane protein
LLHSIKWNYIGAIARVVSQLGIAAILARLLTPADFGLVALGLVIIRFGRYFADFGMGGAVQQKKELTADDIRASFALCTVLGVGFFLATALSADFIAAFFDSPGAATVIQWLALSFVLSGLSTTALAVLKRAFAFKYISIAELVSYLIGFGIVGIGMAYAGFGVYSLVVANLVQPLIVLVMVFYKSAHPLSIPLRMKPYRQLVSFGGNYSLVNFLGFISSNLDHLVIGKFFSAELLGYYNRGKYLVTLPVYHLLVSVTNVLFPAYSTLQDDALRLKALYRNGMLAMGMILVPIGFGMVPAAPQIVDLLLGDQWRESVVILQVCALFVPVEMLTSVAATLCSARGRLRQQLVIQLVVLAFMLPAMYLAATRGTLVHVAIVVAAAYWLRFFIYVSIVRNMLKFSVSELLEIHFPHIFSGVAVAGGILAMSVPFGDLPSVLLLPLQVVAGGLVLLSLVLYGPLSSVRAVLAGRLPAVNERRGVMRWLGSRLEKR